MAKPLYRFSGRIIGRQSGKGAAQRSGAYVSGSVVPVAAAYRYGGKVTCWVDGKMKTFDYGSKLGVVHTELLLPSGGAPAWAGDAEMLFRNVEWADTRVNSQFLRELIITLPRDIDLEIVKGMLRAWVQRELVDLGMIAFIAVHAYGSPLDPAKPQHKERLDHILPPEIEPKPLAPGDNLRTNIPAGLHAWQLPNGKIVTYQPHAHVLLTMREIGPDGFYPHKQRDWNKKALFEHWRESFERDYNALLDSQGICARVTSKARWKTVRDAERAAKADPDPYEDSILEDDIPTGLDLGGGFQAALEGRPPVNGKDGKMTPYEVNQRLEKDRRLKAAYERRLDRALKRVRELQEAGVSFYRYGEADLRYRGPTELVTTKDVSLFDGLHGPLLAVLEATPPPPPAPDDQLAEAFERLRQLQAAGVRFFRTETGALGHEDRNGVLTPEIYRSFSGKHEAILGELARSELEQRSRGVEEELAQANAKATTATARAEESEAKNAQLSTDLQQAKNETHGLERGLAAISEALEQGKPVPEQPVGFPVLRRLATVVSKMRGLVVTKIREVKAVTEERDKLVAEHDRLVGGVNKYAHALLTHVGLPTQLADRPAFQKIDDAVVALETRHDAQRDRAVQAEKTASEQAARAVRAEKVASYLHKAFMRTIGWAQKWAPNLAADLGGMLRAHRDAANDIQEGRQPSQVTYPELPSQEAGGVARRGSSTADFGLAPAVQTRTVQRHSDGSQKD